MSAALRGAARLGLPDIARARSRGFFEGDRCSQAWARSRRGARFPAPTTPWSGAPTRCSCSSSITGRPRRSRISARASWRRARAAAIGAERPLTILVATSGDTGGAVAAAFHRRPWVRVVILYPKGPGEPAAGAAAHLLGRNVQSLRVAGTFDDCQRLVKEAFAMPDLPRGTVSVPPTASISAGCCRRWCITPPRVSTCKRRTGAKACYIIPAGNLGNAFAAVWARAWAFPSRASSWRTTPIDRARFLETACGARVRAFPTLASAMDVGNPSNMERVRALYPTFAGVSEQLSADSVDDATIRSHRRGLHAFGREWCPHTATAAEVYARLSGASAATPLGAGGDRASGQVQRNRRADHRQAGRGAAELERLLRLPQHFWILPPTLEALAAALE
jgi:threonine synthase